MYEQTNSSQQDVRMIEQFAETICCPEITPATLQQPCYQSVNKMQYNTIHANETKNGVTKGKRLLKV